MRRLLPTIDASGNFKERTLCVRIVGSRCGARRFVLFDNGRAWCGGSSICCRWWCFSSVLRRFYYPRFLRQCFRFFRCRSCSRLRRSFWHERIRLMHGSEGVLARTCVTLCFDEFRRGTRRGFHDFFHHRLLLFLRVACRLILRRVVAFDRAVGHEGKNCDNMKH